jgi:inorganic pyrophosphatase
VYGGVQVTMAAARAMVAGCVSRLPQCVGSAVVRGSGRQALASTSSLSMRAAPLRHSALQRAAVQQSRNLQGCRVVSAEYTTAEEGAPESLEYRVFFSDKSGKTVSPPLQP